MPARPCGPRLALPEWTTRSARGPESRAGAASTLRYCSRKPYLRFPCTPFSCLCSPPVPYAWQDQMSRSSPVPCAISKLLVVANLRQCYNGLTCRKCAFICLVVLNAALLVLWTTTPSSVILHTRATIPAAVLTLVSSLGLALLSWLSHERSVRPSFVLSTYLFVSVLLDTARARTLWMIGPHQTIPAVFTCTLALRAVMILLESTEKRRILVPQHKGYSKEVTSGTFNRSVFFWLTSLFVNGYRNILRLDDLYPLDPKLASGPLYNKLADAWDKGRERTSRPPAAKTICPAD